MEDEVDKYRVKPGQHVDLSKWDPADRSEFDGSRREGVKYQKKLRKRLAELQQLMWAEDRHKLLVVFQAMDTGGKDGTIRKVFSGVNPQGIHVVNFKAPTSEELDHDYLWRIHDHTPETGSFSVFNRSHYEDVLIVRVLDLVPEARWSRRYGHINDFERLLADEGTTILKFYLHISKEEQAERLQARLDDDTKHWKFNAGDLEHRALWADYMAAYEAALEQTSTAHAPWHVVPANRKWYRNIVITKTIVDTLEGFNMQYPDPEDGLADVVIT
ncbi:MAG: polyphosphate kinase 2 family protein [bacterium]|nr:polyphosphate kinase 2 family protein [bacterium]MCP4968272.1 polyphosphate kinase 2 family protein [bacterium]